MRQPKSESIRNFKQILKSMKKLMFMLFWLGATSFYAQSTVETRATDQTNLMKTELNLTDDQYSKVYTINLGIIQKNEDIKNSTYSDEVKKDIIKSNNDTRKAMLKDVLTVSQYETMTKIVKKAVKKKKREKAQNKEIKN